MLLAQRKSLKDSIMQQIEQLEYIDSLLIINQSQPIPTTTTLADAIAAVQRLQLIEQPTDWVALKMLADDLGKTLGYSELLNALKLNAKGIKLPLREALCRSYIEHTRKHAYPNWPNPNPRSKKRLERLLRIAQTALPYIQNMA